MTALTIDAVHARLAEKAADQQLAALRSAQQIYDNEFAPCPRSPEWKLGARAGVWKAMGLKSQRSPYANGTAQDDAWRAGFQVGFGEVRHLQEKGRRQGGEA